MTSGSGHPLTYLLVVWRLKVFTLWLNRLPSWPCVENPLWRSRATGNQSKAEGCRSRDVFEWIPWASGRRKIKTVPAVKYHKLQVFSSAPEPKFLWAPQIPGDIIIPFIWVVGSSWIPCEKRKQLNPRKM